MPRVSRIHHLWVFGPERVADFMMRAYPHTGVRRDTTQTNVLGRFLEPEVSVVLKCLLQGAEGEGGAVRVCLV